MLITVLCLTPSPTPFFHTLSQEPGVFQKWVWLDSEVTKTKSLNAAVYPRFTLHGVNIYLGELQQALPQGMSGSGHTTLVVGLVSLPR